MFSFKVSIQKKWCLLLVLFLFGAPQYSVYADHTRDLGELRIPLLSEQETQARATQLLASDRYTLALLLEVADLTNPAVRAAALEANAAEGLAREARLYPNPMLAYEERDMPTNDFDFGESTSFAAVKQPVVIGKRRGAARDVAISEMNARYHRYEAVRNRVLADVHRRFVEQLAYGEELRSVRRHLDLLDELTRDGKTALDRRRFSNEAERLALEVTRLTAERVRSGAELQALLGVTRLNLDRFAGELPSGIDYRLMSVTNAELIANYHPVQEARSELLLRHDEAQLVRSEVTPDITLMAGGGYNRRMDEGFLEAGVEVPLPIFNRRQGDRFAAQTMIQAAENTLVDAENNARVRIELLRQFINESDTIAELYREEITPDAEEILDLTREAYATGEAGATDLLDAIRGSLSADSTRIRYALTLGQSLAELEEIQGHGKEK